MDTQHRRLFWGISSLFDSGASVVRSWPPFDPKNICNFPELSEIIMEINDLRELTLRS